MKFSPSDLLKEAEKFYLNYRKSIDKKATLLQREVPEVKDPEFLEKCRLLEKDLYNRQLISFYKELFNLQQKSYSIKQSDSNLINHLKEIDELNSKILIYINLLILSNAEVWNYLTDPSNPAGREAIFDLLNNYLGYSNDKHYEWLIKKVENLLNKFLDTEKKGMGLSVLEFYKFNTDPSYLNLQINEETGQPQTDNILIIAQGIFKSQVEPAEKIKLLRNLAKTPLKFDETAPHNTSACIKNRLFYEAITNFSYDENLKDEFSTVLEQLTHAGYFNNCLLKIWSLSSFRYFYQIIGLRANLVTCLYHYTLLPDHMNDAYKMNAAISMKAVCLFGKEKSKIKLPNEILNDLKKIGFSIVENRDYYSLSFKDRLDFWQGILKISAEIYKNPLEFVRIIDGLIYAIQKEQISETLCILVSLLNFRNLTEHARLKYTALLGTYKFIGDLKAVTLNPPEEIKEEPKDDEAVEYNEHATQLFIQFLEGIETYWFEGLETYLADKNHRDIKPLLKGILIETLSELPTHIDIDSFSLDENENFLIFQKTVLGLAKTFGANDKEIKSLSKILRYEDNHFLKVTQFAPETNKKLPPPASKGHKKKHYNKPKEHKPAETTSTQEIDPTIIQREDLPIEFLEFSEVFTDLTHETLILVGGAVAYLLRKKGNPGDYDCIVLNLAMKPAELCELLKEKGFQAKVVGEYMPLLKVRLGENKKLKIDITFYNTEPVVNGEILIKVMKEILAQRDLKDSAMYMVLTPGAEFYRIKASKNTIQHVIKGYISLNFDDKQIFDKDFTRFFRVVKKKLRHPEDEIQQELKVLLRDKNHVSQIYDNFVKDGCSVYFMTTPPKLNHYLESDLIHLYLYNDPEKGIFFITHHDKMTFIQSESLLALLKEQTFDQPKKYLQRCKNRSLVNAILKITSKENHTLTNSHLDTIRHRHNVDTALKKLFKHFDAKALITLMGENSAIIEGMTAIPYRYLMPTLDALVRYQENEVYKNENPHYRKISFDYFIHIHYCLLKHYDERLFKEILMKRYQSKSFKNSPYLKVSGTLRDLYKETLHYIEVQLLGIDAEVLVAPQPNLVQLIAEIKESYHQRFEVKEAKLDKMFNKACAL